jgi:3-oxoacyl-[acyl-carrier protein] reductase
MSDSITRRDISARFPDLAGKAAIVTGTSHGLGPALAEFLAMQGMKLLTTARSADAGAAIAAELAAGGAECAWVAADLSTRAGAQQVFDAAVTRFGRIDLLVNNAALTGSKPFLRLDEETFHTSTELNLRMIYYLSHLVAHHMVAAGGGSIIHISSVGGLRAHRGLAGYDASKGAIDALTRAMAVELAPHNIRVNTVAPGATLRRPFHERQHQFIENAQKMVPLGRMGTGSDVGAAVAFLASDAASYITGQILYVDGGITAQLVPPGQWV